LLPACCQLVEQLRFTQRTPCVPNNVNRKPSRGFSRCFHS
jgi:hypothetical protein